MGDKSIQPQERLIRIYPSKNLFSHIIGQIDDNNNGISGLEKSLDEILKKSKEPIKLSVDKDIQFLIRNELINLIKFLIQKEVQQYLMNVDNGEILSLYRYLILIQTNGKKFQIYNFINRATKGVYEFGSVFKTFTLASAFDKKIIQPETKFLDLPKTLKCAGFNIKEYDKEIPKDLTAEQILISSGNIGSVRIAQKLGD